MMPFIHIGPITFASFGLCVGIAMLISYFVLARDVERREIQAPPDLLVAVPCIAGLIGAKLYHVFETPKLLIADPKMLISQYGFAWFGGLLGGLAGFIWMARRYRVPLLEMFDAAAPAAALGYGIGRIGCLISGDGDYGKPTSLPWGMSFPHGLVPTTDKVHPTPIYELIVACLIAWILWRIGTVDLASRKALKKAKVDAAQFRPYGGQPLKSGHVFAMYLLLTGIARFLVEFIRINPRSFFGMTNAQTAALASIILGAALLWQLHSRTESPGLTRRAE